jgi:hypothetical protein
MELSAALQLFITDMNMGKKKAGPVSMVEIYNG